YLWNSVFAPKTSNYRIRVNASSEGGLGNSDISDGDFTLLVHTLSTPTILHPNGGELINDSVLIQWTEPVDSWGYNSSYTLYYSSNGGSIWIEIITDLNETYYLWNSVSAPKTSNYKIRVNATSEYGLTNFDESDDVFTLQAHSLSIPTIIHPNGGEIINDSVLIQWAESFDTWDYNISYTLYYSSDGGSSWIEIISGLEETSYLWNSASAPKSSTYKIRVNATSEDGLTEFDDSDGVFTLQTHTLSTPTILYPNGGEIINDSVLIQW
ncbi:unnamed protein product, partial [marine sediment metagenome]